MKQGKVLLFPMIIVAVLCVAGLIAGLIFGLGLSDDKPKDDQSVFDLKSAQSLNDFGFVQNLNGDYEKGDADAFGYTGKAVAGMKEDAVARMSFTADILSGDDLKVTQTEEAVAEFAETFSNELGFPGGVNPQKIQFADDETYKSRPENEYEALMKGYLMFEYSYRDADGILWIVQIYSPRDHIVSASVIRYYDDSGFTDFEAQVNLQRK